MTQKFATTHYLLTVLEELAQERMLESSLRTRILDILAQTSEEALASGSLAQDPVAAAARMEEVLVQVKDGHPLSGHLYSAQIRLAHFRRDVLGQPEEAAASLERLLTDLDLPLEGVALARLTLGECYLAAGDTARGRVVLTRLGRSSRFREAAGHAHYHLARLDLAEGHWETARDRFASVAMDNPMADYANDALDLGLAIAEELDNPTGGPSMLTLYARSTYFDLTAQPDSQRVALEYYLGFAVKRLDLEQPQHLLERGRYELARLYWKKGLPAEALLQCDRIIMDHPGGRYPAEALALRGRILSATDDQEQAREAFERLLLQYPDYLFADDIRDQLRRLP
jgi:tetratricopeptide (TPR) repeat protein